MKQKEDKKFEEWAENNLKKKIDKYFKRNPIAYALALEGNGFDDKKIQNALKISKWYSKKIIDLTMQQLKTKRNPNEIKKYI